MNFDTFEHHTPGWRRSIQWVLRGGLIVGAILAASGLVLAVAEGEHAAHAVRLSTLRSDGTFAERVIAAGLLVLAATPVLRVATLVGIWLRQRDYRFALLGSLVLVILLASALTSGR